MPQTLCVEQLGSPENEDDSWVKQVTEGDQAALLCLYDRYSVRVYTLAMCILGDQMMAEEVTQDVFFKVWKRACSYLASRGSFATWLLAITRNTAIDCLRREQCCPIVWDEASLEENWENLADVSSTSEETRWRCLHLAVEALVPQLRQAIELAYYQGLSHVEIAKYLGWPLGTVKTRLRIGVQQLRRQWLETVPNEKSVRRSAGV